MKPSRPPARHLRCLAVAITAATGLLATIAVARQTRPAAAPGHPQAVELASATISPALIDATVLAVGEATHGTSEFRQAWLEVTKKVADHGFTTIALEEDAGCIAQVNDWLQGGPGTAAEAVGRFGFSLNMTRDTADFLTWIRDHNQNRPASQRIQLYGIDAQRPAVDRDVALHYLRQIGPAGTAAHAEALRGVENSYIYRHQDQATAALPAARHLLTAVETVATDDDAALRAVMSARALVQALERGQVELFAYDRDRMMADNLAFLVAARAQAGSHHTLLLAHNGHVDRSGQSNLAPGSKLGVVNAERWGEAYRVIGTDARHVAIHDNGRRHRFTVESPIRAQFAGTRIGYLELAQTDPANRAVWQQPHPMATAGTPFRAYAAWLPFLHAIRVTAAETWDALIYVERSTPTTPL